MKITIASTAALLILLSACSSSNSDVHNQPNPATDEAVVENLSATGSLAAIAPDQTSDTDALVAASTPESGAGAGTASVSELEKIVILASGQSNISRHQDFSWSPPANLKVWNLHRINEGYGSTDQDVGSAFEQWPNDDIMVSVAYAAEVARLNPNKEVRLISIAWGGKSIDHWVDRATPDIYAMVKLNADAAMAQLPEGTQVDEFLWWQGESDENPYLDRYLQMEKKFRTQNSWFSPKTKIILVTPNPSGNGGLVRFNEIAQSLFVASLYAPRERVAFVPSAYEFEDGIHLDTDQFLKFSRDLKRFVDDRLY